MKWMKFLLISGVMVSVLLWCMPAFMIHAQQSSQKSIEEQLISLDFNNVELKDAIRSISAKTGISIIIEPEVEGKVTARFEKPIPVLRALSIILSPHGYRYVREDNIIRVKKVPVELVRNTFHVQYALAQEVAPALEDYLSDKGELKVDTSANSIMVVDVKENMNQIKEQVEKIDSLPRQLTQKSFNLQYALAKEVASFLKPELTENGSVRVSQKTNSVTLKDTSLRMVSLTNMVQDMDTFSATQKVFSLKYALAQEAFSSVKGYLSKKGEARLFEDKNQILVIDAPYPVSKVQGFIQEIDNFSLQVEEARFEAQYLYPQQLVSLIKPYLSPKAQIKVNSEQQTVWVRDAAYPLSVANSQEQKADVFVPQKQVFKLQYASAQVVSHKVSQLLSPQGEIKVEEKTNTVLVTDDEKFLHRVAEMVKKEDKMEDYLVTKKYTLYYLSAEEARVLLEPVISEAGKMVIRMQSGSKTRPAQEQKVEGGVITIPSNNSGEKGSSNEQEDSFSSYSSHLQCVVYITDLERNFPEIEQLIQELNSGEWASKAITRTFYIEEGSVERIALTIANMLGLSPEEVEGLQLKKGGWMQMQLASPSIDLGNIGAIGKK